MTSSTVNSTQSQANDAQAPGQAAQVAQDDGLSSLPFTQFVWGAGIECSFLPHLNVDQFQWTQHNRYWRDDFKLAKNDLGINHLRYAFPWHELEPTRGQYNWKLADERIEEAQKLGLNLMVDVMPFCTPLWLK